MRTRTVIGISCVNALGFSASTILPLWLGRISAEFAMPAWFTGAAVVAQLGGAALLNLATPFLFRRVPIVRLARIAFLIAAVAYLGAITHSPTRFLVACLLCGAALGTVLNVTNRLMGSIDHVQTGYSIFVMIEICVAATLFLSSATLIEHFGLLAVFPVVSLSAAFGAVLLGHLSLGPLKSISLPKSPEPGARTPAVLTLISFALFFVGQAALNSFMPTIGQASGFNTLRASQIVGLGMPCGFVGAILARVLGERVMPLVPVAIVVAVLACIAPFLTAAPSPALYVVCVLALAIGTLFSLPYFFAQLGALDRFGRYTAFGPAMMLLGLASGPSSAVLLAARFGLAAIGVFSAALLVAGGLMFAISAVRLSVLRSVSALPGR